MAEQLVLRAITEEDATHILHLNDDPEVLRHVHDEPFADAAAARRWIANIDKELPHGFGRWSITLGDGTWIGRCSLRNDGHGTTLMGYRLLRAHWGRGHGTATVGALLHLAFHTFGLDAVTSLVAPDNHGSRRVLEKNGAHRIRDGAATAFPEALVYRIERRAG